MTAGSPILTTRPSWKALEAHHQQVQASHPRNLFADDPTRGERMTAEAVGLYPDYSKNRITDETLKLLLQLAEESSLRISPSDSSRQRSASSSPSTSTASSPRAPSGTSTRSTSGASNWVKCWPSALSPNWKARQSPCSAMIVQRTPCSVATGN
jgi:hypothetical protein